MSHRNGKLRELLDTGLFSLRNEQGKGFNTGWAILIKTNFYYNYDHEKTLWVNNNSLKIVTREFVLDNSPRDIQDKLLFHLDLL